MIKKNWKTLLITSLIALIPFFYSLVVYPTLPETIPIHFNIVGEPDGWGHKRIILIMPLLLLFIQWTATLELHTRDKKTPVQEGEDYISIMSWTMAVCSVIMAIVIHSAIANNMLSAQRWVPIALGAMFVMFSNKMPKYQQNRWFGLRIPYTLNDKENWFKTHRLAAKVGVVGGLLLIGSSRPDGEPEVITLDAVVTFTAYVHEHGIAAYIYPQFAVFYLDNVWDMLKVEAVGAEVVIGIVGGNLYNGIRMPVGVKFLMVLGRHIVRVLCKTHYMELRLMLRKAWHCQQQQQ